MKTTTDLLIIGSGVAGLTLALSAAQHGLRSFVISKNSAEECNTTHAQGGVAAVLSPDDSIESHIRDTLETGNGLSHLDAVTILAEEGPSCIHSLVEWGTQFTRSPDSVAWNQLDLGREGGHRAHRIVHARDHTGREMEESLLRVVRATPEICILEYHTLIELITDHSLLEQTGKEQCYGVYILDRKAGKILTILASATVLATGGIGMAYEHTTNPTLATGDGIAAAWRAGAQIANLEFIQFHPTSLYHPQADSFLISEALRGYGAILKNRAGKEFMTDCHAMGSLAPRDIVARAIDKEIKMTGDTCVFLDIRHANPNKTRESFPLIYAHCLQFGIDITRDLIPVVPASHYSCGGILVDKNGKTSIYGLYAVGEASHTGVHGANRLASNSLLEALVFGRRCANNLAKDMPSLHGISKKDVRPWDDSGTTLADEWVLISHNMDEIRRTMWDYVGIVRNNRRLERALKRICLLRDEIEQFYRTTRICTPLLELRNVACVSELIIRSALMRKESRGLHFTTDYPEKYPAFEQDTIISNNG